MGNRLDTELKQITESISLLKDSHEINKNGGSIENSPEKAGNTSKGTGRKKVKHLVIKDSLTLPSSPENARANNMTLNDP